MFPSAFSMESDPAMADILYLEDRLYEFNVTATGHTDGQWMASFVRDEAGTIVAGIAGTTWGGCCEITQLWVEESRRGQGLGKGLLTAAEAEARRRKCTHIIVMTHSFQGPDFYPKYGFETLYAVADWPAGYQHIILKKVLNP